MRVSRVLKSIFENVNRSERVSVALDLLNVPETASKQEIHKAYIKQAKIYHPDVVGNLNPTKQAEMFQSVYEAYEILLGKSVDDLGDFQEGEDLAEEDFTGYEKISSIAYAKHVLGIKPNATSDEVDQAYKQLSFQYHPDLNDELSDDEIAYFSTISEAYKTFKQQKSLSETQQLYEKEKRADGYERPDFWNENEYTTKDRSFKIITTNYEDDPTSTDTKLEPARIKTKWWWQKSP